MNKKLKVILIALILLIGILLPSINNYILRERLVTAQDYHSLDTIQVSLVSDGTHKERLPETYLKTENGFELADNTSTDGVVASKDTVIYQIKLTINAGKERDIYLKLSIEGDGLETDHLNAIGKLSGFLSTEPQGEDTVKIHVKRGLSGEFTTNLAVKAKDTAGETETDNRLVATLLDTNQNEIASSKSQPVTVISTVMADLTLDTGNALQETSYYQTDTLGSFVIRPYELQPNGYANYGISARATWHANLNVADFPDGTEFFVHGENQKLTVQDNKIELTGTGIQIIDYKLPESSRPTNEAVMKTYAAHLENVRFDKSNYADPGDGKANDYNTFSAEISSMRGGTQPNNNYTVHRWLYKPPGNGIWDMSLVGPTDNGKTLFEEQNTHWTLEGDTAYLNSKWRRSITSGNDFAAKITISTKNANVVEQLRQINQPLIFTDKPKADDNPSHRYDSNKAAQVFVGDTPLNPNDYEITWQVNNQGEYSNSGNTPPENATSARVEIKQSALNNINENIRIYLPLKGLDYQDSDRGKATYHQTSSTIGNDESSTDSDSVYIVLPQPLTVTNNIDLITKDSDYEKRFVREVSVQGQIINPTISKGYTYTQTMTFHESYDLTTIDMGNTGWQIQSVDPVNHKVTFIYTNATLTTFNEDNTSAMAALPENNFKIKTIPYYNTGGNSITAPITVETKVTWDNDTEYLSGIDSQKSNEQQSDYALSAPDTADTTFTFNQDVSSFAKAEAVEVNDPVTFTIYDSFGKLSQGDTWYQKIILPSNNDNHWDYYNATVDSEQDRVSPNADGYSSVTDSQVISKYHGDYILSKITLRNAPKNTLVDLYGSISENGEGQEKLAGPLSLNEDGTVNLPDNIDLSKVKYIELHDGPTDSNVQSTGAEINIEIQPTDNQAGDYYMIWPIGAESSKANKASIPWAVGARVVSSSISGTVFNDKNGNGIKESDEEVYKNITVELLDANGHSLNRSVKTDANGSYQFTELHSGNYQVKLPNVIRGEADTVSEVKDSNTSLKAKVKNRFGVDEQTVQTVAYNQYGQNATSQVSVNVPKESTIKNVDFGYHTPNHDASLDKSPATVSYKDGLATLRWDIAITNTGDAPLAAGKLFDRTSKDVKIAKTQFSYGEKVASEQNIQGTIRKVIGFQMPETNGVLVFTDVGVWASTPSQNKRIVLKDASGKITPLPGNLNPEGFLGKGPFESSKGGGMAFWSGNELYMVKNDASSTDSNLAGKIIAQKITFDQPIKSIDGLYPCRDGVIVITTDNKVFQIKSDGSKTEYDASNWNGSTPTVVFGNTQFKILGTTNGAYLLDSTTSSTVTKLNGITGEIAAGSGNGGSEGWLIVNNKNQCWIVTKAGTTERVTSVTIDNVPISGTPIKTYGYRPNGDGQGAFLQTTQGVYIILSGKVTKEFKFNMSDVKVQSFGGSTMLVTGKEDNQNKFYILNIDGTQKTIAGLPTTGDIKALAGDGGTNSNAFAKGQFEVLIDNALYMIDNNQVAKIYESSEELLGFGARYLSVSTTNTTNYSYIYTANKVYFIENKASGEVKEPATYSDVLKLQDGVNIDPSAEITEANFIRRTFDLPTIAPGKTGVITLIGTMNVPKSADKIVGNQAWFTSPMTPRAGITTSAVKGTNMEDGVPDLPTLPTTSNFKPEAIYDTPTVSPNIAEDGSEYNKTNTDDPIPDDLADATPAKITHDATVSEEYVSLAGVAWYDSDNDKKRGEGEERVEHIKVTLLDADDSPIQTTYTDSNGQWQFDDLQKGQKYSVVYQNNWQKDGHTYHPVARLTDTPNTYADDSDVNELSVSDVITLPNTSVTGAIYSGVADMGLATYGEKITLTKGSKDSAPDTPEEIKLTTNQLLPAQTPSIDASKALSATEINTTTHEVDDADNQLFTKAYPFKLTNSGNTTLTNIQLTDTTNQGNEAVINTHLKKVDADGKEISSDVHLVGNSFKNESGSLITLDPGESITGYFQVALDQNHAIHQNTMQVTADVQDNPTIQVTDSDGFKLSYDYQDQTTIRLKKVDAYKNTALKNATFKLYATNATNVDSTSYSSISKTGEALATLTTNENGEVSTQLAAGIYWLEETATPTGYIPPNGHWIMQVSFNESGSRDINIYADSSMPFVGVIGTDAYVTVKNYPFIQVPDTGGYRLWLILAGATLVSISGVIIVLNKKKRRNI